MPSTTTWIRPPSADTLKLNYLERIEGLLKETRDLLKTISENTAPPKVRKVRKGYE